MILPGAVGLSKIRYCREHDNEVKPIQQWPKKKMNWECKDGCNMDQSMTILKTPIGPGKRR
jgi:hypothetical protein